MKNFNLEFKHGLLYINTINETFIYDFNKPSIIVYDDGDVPPILLDFPFNKTIRSYFLKWVPEVVDFLENQMDKYKKFI